MCRWKPSIFEKQIVKMAIKRPSCYLKTFRSNVRLTGDKKNRESYMSFFRPFFFLNSERHDGKFMETSLFERAAKEDGRQFSLLYLNIARLTCICFVPAKGLITDISANSSNIAFKVPLASKSKWLWTTELGKKSVLGHSSLLYIIT